MFQKSRFFIKLLNWEYWPAWVVHTPTLLMWLWFALRARALFFFTNVNPVIETGGVFGESKINILKRIPEWALPKTIFIERQKMTFSTLKNDIEKEKINYPLIAKPDVGERGFMVSKIENDAGLLHYYENIDSDFLIQEFADNPLEISVLYYRLPSNEKGKITSVCIKDTLKVDGDGQSTIESLMENYPRALLQLDRFKRDFPELIKQVPKTGETVELEPIGNHSRGTTFLNGNQYIDAKLEAIFDEISVEMHDIFYGRFDMKCDSFEELRKGKGLKILEFNGIASEPAHIYDPSYSIWQSYVDLWSHWKVIFKISQIQKSRGVKSMKTKTFLKAYLKYLQYLKSA